MSQSKKEDFEEQYWKGLWHFYDEENGYAHVRAFLEKRDLSAFNPKAPPKRNDAFYEPAEEGEMADVIDAMGNPPAFTIQMAMSKATALAPKDINGKPDAGSFAFWLGDRKNRRRIPHRMDDCGYSPLRNKDVGGSGTWRVDGKRQMIYVKSSLSPEAQQKAAEDLADKPRQYAEPDDNVVPMRPQRAPSPVEVEAPPARAKSYWNTDDPAEIDF